MHIYKSTYIDTYRQPAGNPPPRKPSMICRGLTLQRFKQLALQQAEAAAVSRSRRNSKPTATICPASRRRGKIMLARAELDPGVSGDILPSDKALHDAMCAVDGSNAKDGAGHYPSMLFLRGESHMSEVFSFDTA